MSRIKILASVFLVVVVAVLIVGGLSAAQTASSSNAGLMGTVKSSDGKPMEGVIVTARAAGATFTTSVYTDQNGKYFFPPLDNGQYKIWAQAVGFEAERAALAVSANNKVQQSFTLKPLQDFGMQLSGAEWVASLPSDTLKDRRMQRIIAQACSQCHQLGFVLSNRFDADAWRMIVDMMEKGGGLGPFNPNKEPEKIIHAYKEEIVPYLARVRGPNSPPLKYKPFPRPTGEATQVVVTEYDLPLGETPDWRPGRHDGSIWSEGEPSGIYQGKAAHEVMVNIDGSVWFGDTSTVNRTLGKLDPRTGRITNYSFIDEKTKLARGAHSLRNDADGNIWFPLGGTVVKFDPKTEKFTHFPAPSGRQVGGGYSITVDSKGNPWVATVLGAAKLDPKTGQYTDYKAVNQGVNTIGIDVDAEGHVWFTQPTFNKLGAVNSLNGEVSEVVLGPLSPKELNIEDSARDREVVEIGEADTHGGPISTAPYRMAADRKSDTAWFAETAGDRLVKMDIRTRKVTAYPFPHWPYTYGRAYAVVVDKNHMVWVSTEAMNRVLRFNPQTEKFTVYQLPSMGALNKNVAVDNSTDPPTVWVPHYISGKLARIQFRE